MAAGAQLDKTPSNSAAPGGPQAGAAGGVATGESQLAGPLGKYWERGRAQWRAMPASQRRPMAIGAALVVALLIGLAWYGGRTDWRTLYAGLDPEDSRQMAQVLTQAQIPFDLAANGTAIRVPLGSLDKARLATSAKGGPRSGRMGFELFDKPNWVGSEFDEQVNYQRALEGELEHTVATLADVQSARVHLVMPHDSLFRDQERPAKAAVVLTLRHRSLADGEADAIRNLVASAVDGLSPAQVSLIDASGHLPLGPKTAEAMRLGMEDALEAKLIETLEPVTGPGNVRASVTVDYDPTSTDVTEESYDPTKVVTLSMQRTDQTTGSQPVPAGVPGTASNAPNAQPLPVYPQQITGPQSAKSESASYGASRTVRHTIQAPGHIRRLTAAVVVNDRVDAASGQKSRAWKPRSAEELRTLTALAQAAVGFDPTRGDLVTVQDLAFDENRTAVSASWMSRTLDWIERSPVLVKYGTLLASLTLLILLAIRPALTRAGQPGALKPPPAELGAGTPAAPPSGEEVAQQLERERVQRIFDQVTETLKRDPAQSSRLLQSWIHSD